MDMPKKRSNHLIPTPKGAGLIIIPTIIVSIVFFIYFDLINSKPWLLICLLTFILWVTSIFDDFYNFTGWDVGELKALEDIYSPDEYEYLAFSKDGCQGCIRLKS